MQRLRQHHSGKKKGVHLSLFASQDSRYVALDDETASEDEDMLKDTTERRAQDIPNFEVAEVHSWAVFKEALIHSMDSNLVPAPIIPAKPVVDVRSLSNSLTEEESSSESTACLSPADTMPRSVAFADEVAGQPLATVHYYPPQGCTIHSLSVYERVLL